MIFRIVRMRLRVCCERGRVAVFELAREVIELVEDLFEPQLVDLVNDDEQELVVLRRTGTLAVVLLQREQLVELQEAGIGYGHVLLALSGRASSI